MIGCMTKEECKMSMAVKKAFSFGFVTATKSVNIQKHLTEMFYEGEEALIRRGKCVTGVEFVLNIYVPEGILLSTV